MKTLRLVSVVLMFLLFFSCSTQKGDGAKSQQELLDRVREAVEKKDADAVMKLGRWENIPDSTKSAMHDQMSNCLDYAKPHFRIRDMSQEERGPAEAQGKIYVWNMEPVGYLVVEDIGAGSVSIPVGVLDGRYYVASRRPKE